LVNESVTARGSDVTNPCAPSVHFFLPPAYLALPERKFKTFKPFYFSSRRRNAAAITGERLGAEPAKPCFRKVRLPAAVKETKRPHCNATLHKVPNRSQYDTDNVVQQNV